MNKQEVTTQRSREKKDIKHDNPSNHHRVDQRPHSPPPPLPPLPLRRRWTTRVDGRRGHPTAPVCRGAPRRLPTARIDRRCRRRRRPRRGPRDTPGTVSRTGLIGAGRPSRSTSRRVRGRTHGRQSPSWSNRRSGRSTSPQGRPPQRWGQAPGGVAKAGRRRRAAAAVAASTTTRGGGGGGGRHRRHRTASL